ncbi:MAG: ParB N-terminal domain-containing protein [Pseudomonadota bacterium]
MVSPGVQRISKVDDIKNIEFHNEMALVEVPVSLLDKLPLKNDFRSNSSRLMKVLNAIRWNGYNNRDPVIARVGRAGRWVIEDGGHRLTAAKIVTREFWTNLLTRKIKYITFLLYETENSYSKLHEAEAVARDISH